MVQRYRSVWDSKISAVSQVDTGVTILYRIEAMGRYRPGDLDWKDLREIWEVRKFTFLELSVRSKPFISSK